MNEAQTIAATPTLVSRQPAGSCGAVIVSLPTSASQAVYTGTSDDVTAANGLPLYPGEEREFPAQAAAREIWAIVSSGTETLRVQHD